MDHRDLLRANIRSRMGRMGVNARELSALIGMSEPAFSTRMRGEREFRESELVALARALQTTVEALVRGIDAPGSEPNGG